MAQVKSSHPRSTFRFFVSGPHLGDEVVQRMQTVINQLSKIRTWVIGPPTFADESDGEFRMIGGALALYTALPPFGSDLPKDVDRQHLEEVSEIIDVLRLYSRATGLEVTFELDQTYVGRIKDGEPDQLIRNGLLGEWRKAHGIA